jgi:serine/threonine-protein kinase
VILRALAKNPANRYQTAEEFREDLERVRRGQPVNATPLLPAGTTQVIDRPASRTAVLPPTTHHESEPQRSNWWVPVLVTLFILGLLALVLFLLARNLLNDDPPAANLVTVPEVIGENRRDAERIIQEAGLEVGEVTPVPAVNETQEPGTVVDQDPAADEEVEEGTPVNLTVVEQPDLVAIPPLEGSTFEEAQAALVELGLEPVREDQASDTVEEGDVIGTEPPAGTEVEPGSAVTVFVSTGADAVVVPEVRCQSFASAQNELERAGLNSVISSDTVAVNPLCPLGRKVADQSPRPGEEVEPGTTVTLFGGAEPAPTGPTGGTGGD